MSELALAQKVTIWGMFLNGFLTILKVIVGILAGSSALIVDGIHSLSDLASDLFVFQINRISHKGPDADHPYGHRRFETLGTVLMGSVLLVVAILFAYENLMKLFRGDYQAPDNYAIYAAVLSIVINEWLYRFTIRIADKIHSPILKANAWHHRFDAFSSVVVVIGLFFSMIGFYWMDSAAAIAVALILFKVGLSMVWDAFKELVDTGADPELLDKIKEQIRSTTGVKSFHNLRSRKMGEKVLVDVNIEVAPRISVSEGHEIASWVMKRVLQSCKQIFDITVHIDVENDQKGIPGVNIHPKKLLPLRSDLEAIIQSYWGDHPIYLDLDLHYLNRTIEVIFYCEQRDSKFEEAIREKLSALDYISKVEFWIR